MDLSTNNRKWKVNVHKKGSNAQEVKEWLQNATVEVVDLPGGRWRGWSLGTQGSCLVPGDEGGGGEEAPAPVLLLNFEANDQYSQSKINIHR